MSQRSFATLRMTPGFGSAHCADFNNSVIPNEVRDLSFGRQAFVGEDVDTFPVQAGRKF